MPTTTKLRDITEYILVDSIAVLSGRFVTSVISGAVKKEGLPVRRTCRVFKNNGMTPFVVFSTEADGTFSEELAINHNDKLRLEFLSGQPNENSQILENV